MLHCSIFFVPGGLSLYGRWRNLSYKKRTVFNNKGFSSINHIPGGDDDLFINRVATKAIPPLLSIMRAHIKWARKQHGVRGKTKIQALHHVKNIIRANINFYWGLPFTQVPGYPAGVAAALFYCWWFALAVFGLRLIVQGIVWNKSMKKNWTKATCGRVPLLDIWLFFYSAFVPALWKKPAKTWNWFYLNEYNELL